jgi:hypothetical protein
MLEIYNNLPKACWAERERGGGSLEQGWFVVSISLGEGKAVPVQAYVYRPRGLQKVEVPRIFDSRSMNVAGLSAVRTVHLYSPGEVPGIHFC